MTANVIAAFNKKSLPWAAVGASIKVMSSGITAR